jgi:glycosyltransferase involved in cell wall biosynthesis
LGGEEAAYFREGFHAQGTQPTMLPVARLVNAVVLIPAYNAAPTIAATLKALQTNPDLINIKSVIVFDDASTDGTAEVAKSAWHSAMPLEIRRNQRNLGQWPTTNLALGGLPGEIEWALILHSDDVVKPNWLSLYLEAMQACQDNVATICSSYDCWDSESGRVEPGEEAPNRPAELVPGTAESVIDTLNRGCWWHISGCAIRVQAFHEIGSFEPSMPYCADWEWLLRCLAGRRSVLYLPRSTMLYRQHVTSVAAKSLRLAVDIEEHLRIYEMYRSKGYWSSSQYRRYLTRAFRNICRRIAVRLWRRDITGAVSHARLLPVVLVQLSNQMRP